MPARRRRGFLTAPCGFLSRRLRRAVDRIAVAADARPCAPAISVALDRFSRLIPVAAVHPRRVRQLCSACCRVGSARRVVDHRLRPSCCPPRSRSCSCCSRLRTLNRYALVPRLGRQGRADWCSGHRYRVRPAVTDPRRCRAVALHDAAARACRRRSDLSSISTANGRWRKSILQAGARPWRFAQHRDHR